MYVLVLQIFCLLSVNKLTCSANGSEANDPVFNLDHTALEKNIAAIFNKVAHSSVTTKRSVPAYEAQISQSTAHSTSPSPAITSLTTSVMLNPTVILKATNPPLFRELPSYVPPSRALFTPPLPPDYANPFADKPTLRGTNIDTHSNVRRLIPPLSITPLHERIPIKPPDLIENTTKNVAKTIRAKDRVSDFIKDSFELSDKEKNSNDTIDIVPSLDFTSISRLLSGSNGRKQDIPEILLKPIPTKSSAYSEITQFVNTELSSTILTTILGDNLYRTSTFSSVITLSNRENSKQDNITNNYNEKQEKNNEKYRIHPLDVVNGENFFYSNRQTTPTPSKVPSIREQEQHIKPHSADNQMESNWKFSGSLHVYIAAIMFTLVALYSVYKIVRFNDSTNLLTQSYFLIVHLLLTVVCTLRCFYLFYGANHLDHSLSETFLRFLPSSLLATAFATLILYMSRSTVPALYHNKFSSPIILILAFIIHIILCISLHISGHVLGHSDGAKILPLICQCIYIIICITLGLCYMYVYRVIRSQLHINNTNPVNNHIPADFTMTTLNTAITTTVATALLFILMGFVQLCGIFIIQERLTLYPWLLKGWDFSVWLIELSICGLLAWVASLSQYQLREKQIQQHVVHSGFALFPCASSTSTENMDDALYPTICSTNQAVHNYSIRTGKQVYDDSFPLNTLPEHLNRSNQFNRHSARKTDSVSCFPQETHNSFSQYRNDVQNFCERETINQPNPIQQNMHEHSGTSGSTMLVAEDGFVRFRNLGPEEDNISDSQNIIELINERRNSITCSDRFSINPATITSQMSETYHQNSLPHLHISLHRTQHQIYNNT